MRCLRCGRRLRFTDGELSCPGGHPSDVGEVSGRTVVALRRALVDVIDALEDQADLLRHLHVGVENGFADESDAQVAALHCFARDHADALGW